MNCFDYVRYVIPTDPGTVIFPIEEPTEYPKRKTRFYEPKFERIEKHLYLRQYQTASGEWSTLYYGIFVDWQGIRRRFPIGDNLDDARDKLGELRTLNKGRYDWDAEKRRAKARGMSLSPWIERFMELKASKRA